MTVAVCVTRTFTVEGSDDLDTETDRLLEELLKLEDDCLTDSTVSADLGTSEIEVEVAAMGPTFEEAVACADAAIRTAIHAVGGSTPHWSPILLAQHAELVGAGT